MKNQLSDYENKQVAQTIFSQFGRGFGAMVGANSLAMLNTSEYPNGGLQFRFKVCRTANTCQVILDADDTYTIRFWKIGKGCKKVYEMSGVYCDMLQDIFTSVTGLYCTMGTMGR
jgi:hypothetical protein